MRTPADRIRHAIAFEVIALLIVTPLGALVFDQPLLDIGVVGPGALGKETQNDFHQLIGAAQARGWSSEIQNEPGGMLSYDRLWRFFENGQ